MHSTCAVHPADAFACFATFACYAYWWPFARSRSTARSYAQDTRTVYTTSLLFCINNGYVWTKTGNSFSSLNLSPTAIRRLLLYPTELRTQQFFYLFFLIQLRVFFALFLRPLRDPSLLCTDARNNFTKHSTCWLALRPKVVAQAFTYCFAHP